MINIKTNTVEFKYEKQGLLRVLMETCQNMVKIATGQNGELLVNEYAMDDDTPTTAMKQKLMDTPMSFIVEQITKLTNSDFATDFKDNVSTDANIVVPIAYIASYERAHLTFVDKAIYDILIYGALVDWFTAVNADGLMSMAEKEEAKAQAALIRSVKNLYRKLTFNKISNYTLPTED